MSAHKQFHHESTSQGTDAESSPQRPRRMEVAMVLQTSTAIVLPIGFATFLAQSGNVNTASLSRHGITLVSSVHVSTLSCFKL